MYKKLVKLRKHNSCVITKFPISLIKIKKNFYSVVKDSFISDNLQICKVHFINDGEKFDFKNIFSKMLMESRVYDTNNDVSSRIIERNGIISYEKTYEISGNDIVQGLPKLDSILEASVNAEDTNYTEVSLSIPINNKQKRLSVTSYNIFFDEIPLKEFKLIFNKYNLRENKDPEILGWFYFVHNKFNLLKTLFYSTFKLKYFLVNSLQRIYREQNIQITKKIFESVINTMFSRILIIQPLYNPFSYNETISFKIYLKILYTSMYLKKLPPIGLPIIIGISKSVKESVNFLSSISFNDALNELTKRTLFGPKDWLTSTKADLILGRKLRVGSNINSKNDIYFSVKNLVWRSRYFS